MRNFLIGACLLGLAAPAIAAQVYVQPMVSTTAEYDSNLDLDPFERQSTEGYKLDAAALLGIATPTADTNIEPRIRYEDYPKETSLNRLEGMLDLNSQVTGQRSHFSISGRYDHLNEDEAELPSALYNDINPVTPTNPETGQVNIGVTRDNVYLVPKYQYDVTPLVSVGATGTVQSLSYSVTNPYQLVDFYYYEGELFLSRDFGPRAVVTLGGYGAHYQARSIESNANSGGATVDFDYKWSPRLQAGLSVQYQHTNIDDRQPTFFVGASSTLGANFTATWRQQTGLLRVNIGRTVTPSGGGGLYVDEQAQAEYDKSLTERVSLIGAVLAVRSRGLSANVSDFNRNYQRADLSAKWMLTRTWFLQAGADYIFQKYLTNFRGADDARAFVQFGYQGLPRQ